MVALQALNQPILLIAGGRDKNLPWDEFACLAASKLKQLYLIGEAAPLIETAVRAEMAKGQGESQLALSPDAIHRCTTLEAAVRAAGMAASPGDVVLLSPACTSYDMFRDFEERGDAFARIAEGLVAA
jgi:UDP-N-acetylmuramoylalanine--D-glutamate ligase